MALANTHIRHHAIGTDKTVNQRLHGNAAHATSELEIRMPA